MIGILPIWVVLYNILICHPLEWDDDKWHQA